MSRTQRLFDLIQILRRYRYPISGNKLALELGVSLRTLYRDISTLQAQGASIEGAAGIGYVLKPGFMLPPMMFSEEEIEALVLGSRWVAQIADKKLAFAATNVLAKIAAVIPLELGYQLEYSSLYICSTKKIIERNDENEALLRSAIRNEYKLQITYVDGHGVETKRIIWPFAMGYWEEIPCIAAWCELRSDFRHFKTNRIIKLIKLETHYPRTRQVLIKKWRDQYNIPEQKIFD